MTPAFYLAMSGGHTAAVTAYLHGIRGLGLKPEAICDVLMEGRPLKAAMKSGDAVAVTAFMEGVRTLGLSPRLMEKLIAPQGVLFNDIDSTYAFLPALENGHAAAVTAFMNGLATWGLDNRSIAWIFENRDGLNKALSNGHGAAVTAFIDGLRALPLNRYEVAGILGQQCIHIAMAKGQAATVTALMNGLGTLGLSAEQVADIAAAKYGQQPTGLAYARKGKHVEAERAYMNGLANLRSQGLITDQQIAAIKDAASKCVVS